MTSEDARSPVDRLEGALASLEAAVARVAGAERTRADLVDSLATMSDDRQRLAGDLDAALARVYRLEEASEAVEQRLERLAEHLSRPLADHQDAP